MTKPSAQNAIDILVKLQAKTTVESLAYWIIPNTILTLSGARSLCDGVFYSSDPKMHKKWKAEIYNSIEILKSVTEIIYSEVDRDKNPMDEEFTSYTLMIQTGLEYSYNQTTLLGKYANDLQNTGLRHKHITKMASILKKHPGLSKYSPENLNHAAFGILLGYPDKAILGAIDGWENKDPFESKLIDADIRGAGYYHGPMPVYQYPRNLITDKDIVAHERLWSGILRDFYNSDFHKRLAKNSKFKAKIKELNR